MEAGASPALCRNVQHIVIHGFETNLSLSLVLLVIAALILLLLRWIGRGVPTA